jgi:hypothetical protein
MPERTTHVETLRAGKPVSVGATTLLPIERVVLHSDRGNARVWFSAAKEPYAVVVRDAGGIRAVDTGALEVSLDELRERIPGFDALLMSM